MTPTIPSPASTQPTLAPGEGLVLDAVGLTLGDGDAEVAALIDVSLQVAPGELVAVVGPSGSGKSSLLAVAGGLIRPTSGAVRVGPTALTDLNDRDRTALRRRHIGFVFQGTNLLPALTAREQLLLVRHIDGGITGDDRARADHLLGLVGMSERADRRPHQLSGGERQRVGIARALMGRPTVLLADEPTSALDHDRSQEIVALLAEQAHRERAATVMVTHDPTVLDHADRVVTMADGRLRHIGDPG